MTRKELVRKAMHFEAVPRVPVTPISGPTWILVQAGLSPDTLLELPDAGASLIVETCDRLNVDIVYGGRAIPHIILRGMGGVIDNSRIGLPGVVIKKPLGEIEEAADWTPEKVMENLRADRQYQALLRQTTLIREMTGEERYVSVGSFGPLTTAAQMVGVNEMMAYLADEDYEQEVAELLALAEEVVCRVCQDFLEAGGNLLFIADPVASGDLISEAYFEKYALPALVRTRKRLEKRSPEMLLHICGKTMERIPALAESGITAFSMDSLDIDEAREKANGKICLMGNLSSVQILERKSSQEVEAIAAALVQKAGLNGGFILGPGCDITPATRFENLQAMVRAALR